jgi:RNA-directed DNA polymerase
MSALAARYQTLLDEICAEIARGAAPWTNPVAQQGPAFLGATGRVLRGLPAVIAWHVGARHDGLPLAWRLQPTELVSLDRAAVFLLPAHGGEGLYAAVPDPRPAHLEDGPFWGRTQPLPTQAALGTSLDGLVEKLPMDPGTLQVDRTAILSLAQSSLWPLGRKEAPDLLNAEGAWTHERLARVAAWARWLADHQQRQETSLSATPLWPPSARPQLALREHVQAREHLDRLCRDGLVQGSLPAELRAETATDQRHLLPEQPVRHDVFDTKALRRSPAVGAMLERLTRDPFPGWLRAFPLLGWHEHAGLALALSTELAITPLPSELGVTWRLIGTRLRDRLQRGEPWPTLAGGEAHEALLGAAQAWQRLQRHHRRSTWVHPHSALTVAELCRTGRWSSTQVRVLLTRHGMNQQPDHARIPVRNLPTVSLATLRRPRHPPTTDEATTLAGLAQDLGCDPTWEAVREAATNSTWSRQRRPKRSGGVRWLDVPPPPLRAAQRRLGMLLGCLLPESGTPTAFHAGASPALHARAHAGAVAALRADLADFFPSVHPWHLEPWLGIDRHGPTTSAAPSHDHNLLPDWSEQGRRSLLDLLFLRRRGLPYLPQGAPSSPAAANLAGLWLDRAVVARCVATFGPGAFSYTRYADDLVLSTRQADDVDAFHHGAVRILQEAVAGQRWKLRTPKTRTWSVADRDDLHVCGLLVPRTPTAPLRLDRPTWRRARAALHRLRHRVDFGREAPGSPNAAHGLLAYAYAATGDPRWLAYTSRHVLTLARRLAGPLFSEAFLAGWSDPGAVAEEEASR